MKKKIHFNIINKSIEEQKNIFQVYRKDINNKNLEEFEKISIDKYYKNENNSLNKDINYKNENVSFNRKYYNTSNGFIEGDYPQFSKSYKPKNFRNTFLTGKDLNIKINNNTYNNRFFKKILLKNNNKKNDKIKFIKIIKCEKLKTNDKNSMNNRLFPNKNLKNNYAYYESKSSKDFNQQNSFNKNFLSKSIKDYYCQNNNNKFNNITFHYINQSKNNSDLDKKFINTSFIFQTNNEGKKIIKNHSTIFISEKKPILKNVICNPHNHIKKKFHNELKMRLKKAVPKKIINKYINKIKNKEIIDKTYLLKNKKYIDNNDIINMINEEEKKNKLKNDISNELDIKEIEDLNISNKIVETIEISENKEDGPINDLIENQINNSKKRNRLFFIQNKRIKSLNNKSKDNLVNNPLISNNYLENEIVNKEYASSINKSNISKNEYQDNDSFNKEINEIKKRLFIEKIKNNEIKSEIINSKNKDSKLSKKIIKNKDIRKINHKKLLNKYLMEELKNDLSNKDNKNKLLEKETDKNIKNKNHKVIYKYNKIINNKII